MIIATAMIWLLVVLSAFMVFDKWHTNYRRKKYFNHKRYIGG